MDVSQKNLSPEDQALVRLANSLLDQLHLGTPVRCVEDIGTTVFVMLFEGLCGEHLPGIIRSPVTRQDEIHNCQVVIDTLGSEVLHTNLAHISGCAVIEGSREAIGNLLEIYSGLLEYILNKIDSDISTDNEGEEDVGEDDPDTVEPELIDRILESELQKDRLENSAGQNEKRKPNSGPTVFWDDQSRLRRKQDGEGTTKDSSDLRQQSSTIPADSCTDFETTEDLISEGERWDRRLRTDVPNVRRLDSHSDSSHSDFMDLPRKSAMPLEEEETTSHLPVTLRQGKEKAVYSLTRDRLAAIDSLTGRTPTLSSDLGNCETRLLKPPTLQSDGVTNIVPDTDILTRKPVHSGLSYMGRDQFPNTNPLLRDGQRTDPLLGDGQHTDPLLRDGQRTDPLRRDGWQTDPLLRDEQRTDPLLRDGQRTDPLLRDGQRTDPPLRDRRSTDDIIDTHSRFQTELAPKTFDISSIHGSDGIRPNQLVQSGTYNSLQSMVEETAAMARAAVGASPGSARHILQTLGHQPSLLTHTRNHTAYRSLGRSLKEPLRDVTSSFTSEESGLARARSPVTSTRQTNVYESSESEFSPSKNRRKVSFLVDRSSSDTSHLDQSDPRLPRRAWEDESPGEPLPVKSVRIRTASGTTRPGQKSSSRSGLESDYFGDRKTESYEERLRRQYHEIVDGVSQRDEALEQRLPVSGTKKARDTQSSARVRRPMCTAAQEKQLKQEKDDHRKKIDFLHKIYKEDLDELVTGAKYDMNKEKKLSKEKENEFKKKVLKGPQMKKKPIDTRKTQVTSILKKKTTTPANTVSSRVKKQSTSKGPTLHKQKRTMLIPDEEEILPMMLKEFPHLHLSLHTWHELWRKGLQQIEQITRAYQEVHRKKSQAKTQLEEAEKRQEIMVKIMRKEIEHSQRLKDVKERKAHFISAKNKIHERRMQSAKSRQYYDEYQVRMRAKMLKRRTREETIFKKLFKEGLAIQKDRIRELRKYANEQRDTQVKKQKNEIDSLENYYRDQFEVLAESMSNERQEMMVRDKAQQKVLDQMKKEIRKKMETEIKDLQDQLCRDNDDAYFRQLDADRVVHDLKMAKYHTRI